MSDWFVIEIFPDEEDLVTQIKDSGSEFKILKKDRLGGAEEILQLLIPSSISIIELIITIVKNKRENRKRIKIGGQVISAENLSENELKILLESIVKSNNDEIRSS
ncbi:hypothetical protein ML462_01140 [Gramella lutea]|uniref:Uncharacterized protein n=1 Tax=Christiangramia lutea TaxID=1607951 RepID=A0A9X1V076_9FLAO|nr:hypothetical protein [Christiangramia lutea]MCH4821763.1 hypothetical protein [Christiangramia lutea]